MFYFIDIYSFIPVSGCVGMGTGALLCPGANDAVKTTLCAIRHSFMYIIPTLTRLVFEYIQCTSRLL
jgi:hypothetical protein